MINLNKMKRDYIGREPRDYIVESVTVPEGLEEKVLAAMTQKRKEIEEIQHEKLSLRQEKQEKKAAHKSVAIRAAVIAAVITLMILIIPSSRQIVVSAAESAWNGIIEWMEGYGWINPFYKPTDYYTDRPYPEDAVRGNAEVSTKEIHSNIVKYPNYSYETDFKEDPDGQMSFKSKMPLKVESKDFVINIHDMKLRKYHDPQVQFSDMFFYCIIKRIPSYDMSEKEYDNIWSSKIGTHHYPDYFSYSISTSSSIELSFLKNNKECIRIKFNCFYDNFLNYDDGFNKHPITYEMSNPSITWYDSKYQYLFNNPEDHETEWYLGNILLKIKPENVEICSVTIIFDEMTDLTTTNNFNVIKKILKKDKNNEYKYIDSSENFPFYYVFKSHANIVAGYNPKYYDIEAEAEKNQKLIDEFNSRVK